jgi:probable F420-dependent oxidoreductase
MKIGLFIHNTDDGADPILTAKEAEALGFESIFCPEHTHVPASSSLASYHGPRREMLRTRDPFVTLCGMSTVTTRIKLGTSVCLVVQRDPIVLAKVIASLDLMSNGRVLFGVGAGWNRDEMANHGTDFQTRMILFRERIQAMKAIWTNDEAEFHGRFVNFDRIFSWPKPIQRPYPPVIIGGTGPTALKRVVEFGDGWLPRHQEDLDVLATRIKELNDLAARAGRSRIPVTIISSVPEAIGRYAKMGITRTILALPSGPHERVMETMHQIAANTADYLTPQKVHEKT